MLFYDLPYIIFALMDDISVAYSIKLDVVEVSNVMSPLFILCHKCDIDLMSKISSQINIPIIASGGVGNLDHLVDGIKLGKASAVLAASIFHYGKHSIKEAKDYLDSKGIRVRI